MNDASPYQSFNGLTILAFAVGIAVGLGAAVWVGRDRRLSTMDRWQHFTAALTLKPHENTWTGLETKSYHVVFIDDEVPNTPQPYDWASSGLLD